MCEDDDEEEEDEKSGSELLRFITQAFTILIFATCVNRPLDK